MVVASARVRKLRVVVDGRAHEVGIEDRPGSPLTVWVDGRSYLVDIEKVPPPAGDLPAPSEDRPKDRASEPIVPDAGAPVGPPCESEVRAPMPGKIVEIHARVGDQVRASQVLCSLEAMKMKLAICSPRGGSIASVNVREGDEVGYGDVLLKFG